MIGIRILNAAGQVRLQYTDRITRVVAVGRFSASRNQIVTIPVPGLRPDSNWAVTVTGSMVAVIGNDQFTVQVVSPWTDHGYTVYRR